MMKPETDIHQLAERARNGDYEALGELVERLRVRLFRVALSGVGSYHDAQDVVSSAILQICLHIENLKRPEAVIGWACAITRNEAARLYRERRHELIEDVTVATLHSP